MIKFYLLDEQELKPYIIIFPFVGMSGVSYSGKTKKVGVVFWSYEEMAVYNAKEISKSAAQKLIGKKELEAAIIGVSQKFSQLLSLN